MIVKFPFPGFARELPHRTGAFLALCILGGESDRSV